MFGTRVVSDIRDTDEAFDVMEELGCEKRGVEIMSPKAVYRVVRASGLDPKGANILKQEFLAAGGEAAVSWEALNLSEDKSEVLMMGTVTQYKRALRKLKEQPFGLDALADEIEDVLDNYRSMPPIPWGGENPQIMGVLNVTPDSFYDGGDFDSLDRAVDRAVKMEEEGASVIDIGGESTRPGSKKISIQEELDRVIPVIEAVKDRVGVPISIDTYKPKIAEAAVESGAEIVNDIYALRKKGMLQTAADLDVPVIIMHMQGTPENMQDNPHYDDVITEIYDFLQYRAKEAEKAGIAPEKIVIDPGIGFGKKTEHNLEIINRLDEFTCMGYPVLLGASRKRYLAEILDKDVDERLFGTVAVTTLAVSRSVSVLRVHDVEENLDALKTVKAITDV